MADAPANDAFADGLEAARAGSPAGTHEATDGPQASAAGGSRRAERPPSAMRGGPAPTKVAFVRDYCVRARAPPASAARWPARSRGRIAFAEDGNPAIDERCLHALRHLPGRLRRASRRRASRWPTCTPASAASPCAASDVVLTCKENVFPGLEPAANVVVLPCLAMPVARVLDARAGRGHRRDDSRPTCPTAPTAHRAGEMGELLYAHAVETGEAWSGRSVGFSDVIPEKENLVRDLANPAGVDQRSAFTNLVGEVGDIASGKRRLRNSEVLQEFYERRERARALTRLNLGDAPDVDFVPEGQVKKTLMPKRQLLLQAIERDPSIAKRVNVAIPRIDGERCENALACVGACPTGALSPLPEPGCVQLDARRLHRRPARGRLPARSHRTRREPRRKPSSAKTRSSHDRTTGAGTARTAARPARPAFGAGAAGRRARPARAASLPLPAAPLRPAAALHAAAGRVRPAAFARAAWPAAFARAAWPAGTRWVRPAGAALGRIRTTGPAALPAAGTPSLTASRDGLPTSSPRCRPCRPTSRRPMSNT